MREAKAGTIVPVPTGLGAAAGELESALAAFARAPFGDSGGATRAMAGAFLDFTRHLLPVAPPDVVAGVVQLCVLETVRARMEDEAAGHAAGAGGAGARVVDAGTARGVSRGGA